MFILAHPLHYWPAFVWVILNAIALGIVLGAFSLAIQRKDFQDSARLNHWLFISFVMVCRFDTYKQRRPQAKVSYNLLDSYATSAPKYFGTDNHHRIACDGADGQLACAGKIIAKVRKELTRCK